MLLWNVVSLLFGNTHDGLLECSARLVKKMWHPFFQLGGLELRNIKMESPTCSVRIYQVEGTVPCGKPARWRHLRRPDVYCCARHEKLVMKLVWYDNWTRIKEVQDGKG